MVQFENGAFASTPIPTTTVAVTRNTDILTYPVTSDAQGTSYVEFNTNWATSDPVVNHGVISYRSGSISMFLNNNSPPTHFRMSDSTTNVQKSAISNANGVTRKRAVSWGAAGQFVTGDGAASATGAFDGTFGSASTAIGCEAAGGTPLFGCFLRHTLWKTQYTDGQLQALTSG
jgi:hypothetical protein